MKRRVSWYGSCASCSASPWKRFLLPVLQRFLFCGVVIGICTFVLISAPHEARCENDTFTLDPDTEPPPPVPNLPPRTKDKPHEKKSPKLKKKQKKRKTLWGKNTFMIGAGFSSAEGFLLTSKIATRDLFGVKGLDVSLDANISGIALDTAARVYYDSPNSPLILGFEVQASQQQWGSLEQDERPSFLNVGGRFRIGWKFGQGWRIFAGLRLEHHSMQSPELIEHIPGFPALQGALQPRLLSALSLTLEYQSPQPKNSNSPFIQGWDFSLGVEGSSPHMGSSYTYGRVLGRLAYGIALPYGLHIRLETRAGMLMGMGHSTPLGERFQLGGPGRQLSLLPMLGPVVASNGMLVPLGGQGMVHAKALLYAPIYRNIGLYAFAGVEAGALLASAPTGGAEPWQISANASFAFGLKWFSPIGPLIFGWGVPMIQHPDMPKVLFSFGIGNAF